MQYNGFEYREVITTASINLRIKLITVNMIMVLLPS